MKRISFLRFIIIKIIHKVVYLIRYPVSLSSKLYDLYHKIILKELRPYFIRSYQRLANDQNDNEYNNSGIIWIFWWQGHKYMPQIVRCCFNSVKKNSNGHRVILITKDNIKRYARIPKYIYKKVLNGDISLTHFSDILRFNLLYNYGGLWIDSTMYCTSPLDKSYFSNFYTSGGYQNINKRHQFISTKWTGFLIGGCRHNPIFLFMNLFFNIYWEINNYQLDYFLIDYGLEYVYIHNIGKFRNYVLNKAYLNNPHLYGLVKYLNNPYNSKLYLLLTQGTKLFKLTYKQKFNLNKETFYYRLIKGDL